MNPSTPSVCTSAATWHPAAALASARRAVSRRARLGLFAAILTAPLAHAQSIYATPYYFDVALGTPGVPSVDLNRPIGVSVYAGGIVLVSGFNSQSFLSSSGIHITYPGAYGFAGLVATANREHAVASYSRNAIYLFRDDPIFGLPTLNDLAGPTSFISSAAPAGYVNATGLAARFSNPLGVAVDKNGIIYVADQGNHAIRKITPSGVVTTLAGGGPTKAGILNGTGTAALFNAPSGVAVDGDLNVYVGDYGNNAIRKITAAGIVTSLAGPEAFGPLAKGSTDGSGSAARFNGPWGVAVDGAGIVYVCDSENHTLRRITPAGDVTTIAGLATMPGTTNGSGSAARFRVPANVTLDAEGNLFVTDSLNHTVRRSHFSPRFTTHPLAQVVLPGATVNYAATVASSLTVTYQWRKDGVAIAGATTSALTVANVRPPISAPTPSSQPASPV